MRQDLRFLSLLLATVRLAIPVLLISLAELYGQRAGMVNIGLEGLASIGALVGFLVCYVTGSNWLGLLCGALAGILVNMIYAFSTVTLCADHTVYGMAVNIFAPALASFIYRVYFGTGSDLKQITTMASIAIPGLKDIPVTGPLLSCLIATVMGICLDFLYEKTGSVWVPALCHGAINAFAGVPTLVLNPAYSDQLLLGPLMVGLVGGLPIILLGFWLCSRGSAPALKEEDGK